MAAAIRSDRCRSSSASLGASSCLVGGERLLGLGDALLAAAFPFDAFRRHLGFALGDGRLQLLVVGLHVPQRLQGGLHFRRRSPAG